MSTAEDLGRSGLGGGGGTRETSRGGGVDVSSPRAIAGFEGSLGGGRGGATLGIGGGGGGAAETRLGGKGGGGAPEPFVGGGGGGFESFGGAAKPSNVFF